MLQYIINVSAIWLISLIFFDVILRKESYHSYNRAYLLCWLLAGTIVPLLQLRSNLITTTMLTQPLTVVKTTSHFIDAGTTNNTTTYNWMQWLFIVYLCGVFVSLCVLTINIVKLIVFYRIGKRSQHKNWRLVETGKGHAPFSFFNLLFVSDRAAYSNEQWQMIIVHENQHKVLFHFADVLLLQLIRIGFWFHPLVYIFNQRVLLVHEYQADQAITQQPELYGNFLIEQSLFDGAPSFTNTINRSPIKNRIIMLTFKSTTSGWKKFIVIPIAIACSICCSKNSFAQKFEQTGNGLLLHGNHVTMSDKVLDTITVIDPIAGTEVSHVSVDDPRPLKLNGKEIRDFPAVGSKESFTVMSNNERLFLYMMDHLRQHLGKLEDGTYCITPAHIIVNEQGELAYFEPVGITKMDVGIKASSIPAIEPGIKKNIDLKIFELLQNCPNPGALTIAGEKMPYAIGMLNITVKNHQAFAL
jgi:beta-lactamase regulating signal transducer with metallopeptidase domain